MREPTPVTAPAAMPPNQSEASSEGVIGRFQKFQLSGFARRGEPTLFGIMSLDRLLANAGRRIQANVHILCAKNVYSVTMPVVTICAGR